MKHMKMSVAGTIAVPRREEKVGLKVYRYPAKN